LLPIWPNFHRSAEPGHVRLTITRELIPARKWCQSESIDAYEFADDKWCCGGRCLAYVAPDRKTLEAANLFPNDMFATRSYSGEQSTNWTYRNGDGWSEYRGLARYEDFGGMVGRVVLMVYPDNIRWAEAMVAHRRKPNFAKADDYLRFVNTCLEWTEYGISPRSAKNGLVYKFDEATQAELSRLISEFEFAIEHAKVLTEPDPDAEEVKAVVKEFRSTNAKGDREFQSFLKEATAVKKPRRHRAS
jgi:hypothetical protein